MIYKDNMNKEAIRDTLIFVVVSMILVAIFYWALYNALGFLDDFNKSVSTEAVNSKIYSMKSNSKDFILLEIED